MTSLIPCPTCQKQMSTEAKTCPACGAPRKRTWSVRRVVLFSILGLVILSVIAGAAGVDKKKSEGNRAVNNDSLPMSKPTDPSPQSPQSRPPENVPAKPEVLEVTAEKLSADYTANEIRADDVYKNKTLRVTGVVSSIGKDILNNPYVTLRVRGSLLGVHAEFDDDKSHAIARLSKGEQVVVRCRCTGLTLQNPYLKDCVLE